MATRRMYEQSRLPAAIRAILVRKKTRSHICLIRSFFFSFSRSFIETPGARIQFLLGDEDQDEDDEEHRPHDLFIELNELISGGDKLNESGESLGWKETAR